MKREINFSSGVVRSSGSVGYDGVNVTKKIVTNLSQNSSGLVGTRNNTQRVKDDFKTP